MSKIKDNGKNSFVFYDSFLSAMKHLNDVEFRECVLKIRDYALEGIDEESQSPYVNIILAMAKPNLDSARRRYMASVENGKKGAEYGKLGGAPKGNQNARKKQHQKQPLNVDANEDVDVNEDENDEMYKRCTQLPSVFRKIGSHLIATAVFCILLYQRVC